MRSRRTGSVSQKKETRDYWTRMGRLYLFRSCAYALLTLFVAWLMRGA